MKIFYLRFNLIPTDRNQEYHLVKSSLTSCWVEETNDQGAIKKASFFLKKSDWIIERIDVGPVEVTQKDFKDKDLGLEHFLIAQKEGISICHCAITRDGSSSNDPKTIKPSYTFDIGNSIKYQKRLSKIGRCLHFDAGNSCGGVLINAHSIQKNQSLESIAHNGHVYKMTFNYGSFKKHYGKPPFEKCGINKASTFLGFCEKHDNELFEPIDNHTLIPTDQQVFLYAYRSLCRELFVKDNSVEFYKMQRQDQTAPEAVKDLFNGMYFGSLHGLNNLKRHKCLYDNSLKSGKFSDISYVLSCSKNKPIIAFSGLLYPDFDFQGKELQFLGDSSQRFDLITFCSAPIEAGWGFLFAWHKSSNNTCEDFMYSLATRINDGYNPSDLLFGFVIRCCENFALSPTWWESLPSDDKAIIIMESIKLANSFSSVEPTYLTEGIKNIVNWEFYDVKSNLI